MKLKIFFVVVFLGGVIVGCSPKIPNNATLPVTSTVVTKGPIQDVGEVGAVITSTPFVTSEIPTVSPTALSTAIPTATSIPPTFFVFGTATATKTIGAGFFLVKIVNIGPMSKVVTPLEAIFHLAPHYTGTTRIELIGENGSILYRKIFKTYSNVGYFTRVDEKIDFEIPGAAELSRLQITTFDSVGRIQAVNSVRLLLQSVGDNQFMPAVDENERLLLRNPREDYEIKGGSVEVIGEFNPMNNLPLIIELIDVNGTTIGSRLVQLGEPGGKYQSFTTTVPYRITAKTAVRLVIRQSDDRIDGLAYLFSIPLVLLP
jgi:hypothetical protein